MPTIPNLIDRVQEATGLDPEEAETAAKATLQTLGERVARGEAMDIADLLEEEEYETWVVDWDHERTQDFPVGEFLSRVAEREGVDEDTARAHATAVIGVVEEYGGNEIQRIRTQLPDDYEELF